MDGVRLDATCRYPIVAGRCAVRFARLRPAPRRRCGDGGYCRAIEREPIDRKSQAIVLTEAGVARPAEVHTIKGRFETDLLARLPAEHRSHFLPALKALLA